VSSGREGRERFGCPFIGRGRGEGEVASGPSRRPLLRQFQTRVMEGGRNGRVHAPLTRETNGRRVHCVTARQFQACAVVARSKLLGVASAGALGRGHV
jgi:hypothetical protein